jgi:hypothetical protein
MEGTTKTPEAKIRTFRKQYLPSSLYPKMLQEGSDDLISYILTRHGTILMNSW